MRERFSFKFRAAKKLCYERGWQFKVFTEREIRTAYLANIKFLWAYKIMQFETSMLVHILTVLSDLQEADPSLLIAATFSDKTNQAKVIPLMWHLLANHRIGCDLAEPLNMHSKIWSIEPE